MRYFFSILFMIIALPLAARVDYADAGLGYTYTPELQAVSSMSDGYSYGPVKTLTLRLSTGTTDPGEIFSKAGVFGEYDYTFMDESAIHSATVGIETIFFSYFKASLGCGYMWSDHAVPEDRNNLLDKSRIESLQTRIALGLEFNLAEDYMIGVGVKYLAMQVLTGPSLEAGDGLYYIEVSRKLF